MRIVGITGGTGSGKTTACDYIREKGFTIIDFDKMARTLQKPGMPILMDYIREFGRGILLPNGTLDRKKFGQIIFTDAQKRAICDKMGIYHMDIVMDYIVRDFAAAGKGVTKETNPDDFLQKKVIFLDAPTLFETKLKDMVDEAWVVDVDDETRIQRIIERDGITRADVLKRMSAQMPREEKLRRANVVIDNYGTVKQLCQNIDKALSDLYERVD